MNPGNERLSRLFANYERYGIFSHFLVEDVMATSLSARKMALCRYGVHGGYQELKKSENFRKIRKDIERDFGLGVSLVMQPPLLSETPHPCLAFYRGREPLNAILDINDRFRRGAPDASDEYFEALRAEGTLLGFPRCCVELYAEEKRLALQEVLKELGKIRMSLAENPETGLSPDQSRASKILGSTEKRARLQLSDVVGERVEERKMDPFKFSAMDPDVFTPYFAFEFYPCKPDCGGAREAGEKILFAFRKGDGNVYGLYRNVIMPTNAYRVWSGFHPEPVLKLSALRTAGFLRGYEKF